MRECARSADSAGVVSAYNAGMPRIGFLGAFSIDNIGDLVIGYATRAAIRARIACEEVVLAPDLPGTVWHHDWSAARGLGTPIRRVAPGHDVGFADDLDALIIGGGGIVMPMPGFEPFVLNDPERWGSVPAAWNAVGSQFTPWFMPTLAEFYARVHHACARLRYVSVRNRTTETLVRRCGWDGPIELVPDPAILYDPPPEPAVDAALAKLDLRDGRPLVGVSLGASLLSARTAHFYDELVTDLEHRAAAGEIDVVVFPFGQIYRDADIARRVAARLRHGHAIDTALSPAAAWRLVKTPRSLRVLAPTRGGGRPQPARAVFGLRRVPVLVDRIEQSARLRRRARPRAGLPLSVRQ